MKNCQDCGREMVEIVNEMGEVIEVACRICDCDDYYYEGDGQPTEYEEWQDYYGGDDWDHGQYDDCDW